MQYKRHILAGVFAAFAAWASADQLIETSIPPSRVIKTQTGLVYVFNEATASATFKPTVPITITRALVVGGGGAGGWTIGGGGGGGALAEWNSNGNGVELGAGESIPFAVGAGGDCCSSVGWVSGLNGGESSLDLGVTNLVALGGGGGGSWNDNNGKDGACGGGSSHNSTRQATGSFGGNGGAALGNADNQCPGGGGGASGENGGDGIPDTETAGKGGDGLPCDITGEVVYYGGGGGGAGGNGCKFGGLGGLGGGGRGYDLNSNINGEDGVDGLGGGGGGGSYGGATHGGYGGNGTVIIAFDVALPAKPFASFGDLTVDSHDSVSLSGSLDFLGDGASSADIVFACAPSGETLPAGSVVKAGLSGYSAWTQTVGGLLGGTVYSYRVSVVNDKGVAADTVKEGTFTTWPSPLDPSMFATSDSLARILSSPSGETIVIFTNTTATFTFTPLIPLQLNRALVVGGGGAGGWTIGGGGGGGGAIEFKSSIPYILSENVPLSIRVGAGGDNQANVGDWPNGLNGGDTTLGLPTTNIVAYGGGGGGSWNSRPGLDGACGGGSSCGDATEAIGSQGGNGGRSNGEQPGGGGGASGEAGQAGQNSTGTAGKGGDGLASDITGFLAYYGGGGGGGGGNGTNFGGKGGKGGGGDGQDAGSPIPAGNGIDGLGGGGAGGSHPNANVGGRGGCGTIILSLSVAVTTDPIAAFLPPVTKSSSSVEFSGSLLSCGDSADSVDIHFTVGKASNPLPASTVVKSGWVVDEPWKLAISDLLPGEIYAYSVTVTNSQGVGLASAVTGTFSMPVGSMTGPAPEVIITTNGLAYVFTDASAPSTLVLDSALQLNRALVVGGGGAGGWTIGGGGGGGGVVQYNPADVLIAEAGTRFTVSVGAGGDNMSTYDGWTYGRNGGDSTLAFGDVSITALGGGGGGSWSERQQGAAGGCGGGCANGGNVNAIGSQGGNGGKNNGERSGGGGGAGQDGQDGSNDTAGKGGDGIASDITGEVVYYAGGGGGAGGNSCLYGAAGGLGGGGRGYDKDTSKDGENGVDGLGGGGGGGAYVGGNPGGRGGSGTVILLFSRLAGAAPTAQFDASCPLPDSVEFTGRLGSAGDDAESVDVYLSYGFASSGLSASTLVKSGWEVGDPFSISYSGLVPGAEYAYVFAVTNNLGAGTIVEGTFDTGKAACAYIAPDGNDATGDGSQANPFRTLTRAVSCVDTEADDMAAIHAAPGLYDAAAGEVFPLEIAGVAVECAAVTNGDYAIFDAGNEARNVFALTDGDASLSGLIVRESTSAAIIASDATLHVSDCRFTQSIAGSYWNFIAEDGGTWNRLDADFGVLEGRAATIATFDRCEFSNMDRFALFNATRYRSRFILNDCVAASNTVTRGVFSSYNSGNITAMQLVLNRSDFLANRCRFLDQGGNGYVHDCYECSIAYVAGNNYNSRDGEYTSNIVADRCRFLGNSGANLIGLDYCHPNISSISNSLFVDNYALQGMFQGHEGTMNVYSSTLVRNSGNYSAFNIASCTFYDCIFADGGPMSFTQNVRSNAGNTSMQNSILWNTPDGEGWNSASSTFIVEDPILENAGVAWDDPAFDATPRPYSPAIDAGVNGRIDSALDLAGNTRVADNDRDGTDTIDLGCYESLFAVNPAPAFCMDAPGIFSALRGTTHDVSLWIEPTPNGDVTASVAYPEDGSVTGPETLTFVEGVATLTLSFAPDSTNDWTRAVVSADGIAPLAVDAYVSGCVVTIGGAGTLYIRDGETIVLPVKLDLEGAVASSAVPVAIQSTSGDGANDISWTGGDGIAVGASSTVGGLSLTGHSGVNTVTLQVGAGYTFAETETEYVTVVGYPGWMAVDPANGDDDQYVGTMASPFKTVNRALEVLRDGDTVRMLPGTYDASTQTFPWEPAEVTLAGYGSDGTPAADPAGTVVDGGNTVATLVSYTDLAHEYEGATIANLTIKDTASGAVWADGAYVTASNCVFTQSAENFSAYGAIVIRDDGHVTAEDCAFVGIRRMGVVVEASHLLLDNCMFTARNCVFRDNCSGYAAIAGDNGNGARGIYGNASLYDCDFIANSVGPDNYARISECFRSPTIYLRQGGLTIERCRFLGNVGGPVIAETYFTTYVSDTLFAGNSAVLGEVEGEPVSTGIFDGYGMQIKLFNCTLVGNSGGYNSCNCTPYFYNSIIADDGPFSVMPYGNWMDHQPIRLESTIAYDMAEGVDGFRTNESHNVFFDDPKFKNVSVPWDDARFDARLSGSSPAIDAGRNDFLQASQLVDLAGEPRVQGGLKGAVEPFTVDLGCYERKYVEAGTLIMVR